MRRPKYSKNKVVAPKEEEEEEEEDLNLRYDTIRYDTICLLTAIGLTPGGSSTVHIYTQKIHRTTQITTEQHK